VASSLQQRGSRLGWRLGRRLGRLGLASVVMIEKRIATEHAGTAS
jgi:hypothetical protein